MNEDPFASQPVVLTEEQRAYLEGWVRRAADAMGLRDWLIRVTAHGTKHESYAESFLQDAAEDAWIAVGEEFAKYTPDDQRNSLIHELLHCHFQPVTRMAEKLWDQELGRRTEAILEQAVSLTEERSIQRLATGIAPFFEDVEMPA